VFCYFFPMVHLGSLGFTRETLRIFPWLFEQLLQIHLSKQNTLSFESSLGNLKNFLERECFLLFFSHGSLGFTRETLRIFPWLFEQLLQIHLSKQNTLSFESSLGNLKNFLERESFLLFFSHGSLGDPLNK